MLKKINPRLKIKDDLIYMNIINDIINHSKINEMKNYIHHGHINCYDHCLHVSYFAYTISKRFNLDVSSIARGAFLHDFYLYDWHIKGERKGLHGFTHSKTSLINSKKYFTVNEIEEDIILKHMWPLNLRLPKYKETILVSLADKYCTIKEYF